MKNIKTREDFLNESKELKIYAFDGSFYLISTSEYITSEKKFGGDMLGAHGGDLFDFDIEHIYLKEEKLDEDEATKVEIDGTFKAPNGLKKDELLESLKEYVGDVVESYTKKYPQMFKMGISLYKS